MGWVLCECGVGWCALRYGVVCRKARMVGVGWSAWHPTALSLLSQPPVSPTALSLLSQPPVSPTMLSLLSQPPVSPAALSLLSHPPLFTFSHFRRFPSCLWRTPRILSPCTLKCSWRVCVQPCCLSISYQNVLPSAPCRIFT